MGAGAPAFQLQEGREAQRVSPQGSIITYTPHPGSRGRERKGHTGESQASRQKAESMSPCDQGLTSLIPFPLPRKMPYKTETLSPGWLE